MSEEPLTKVKQMLEPILNDRELSLFDLKLVQQGKDVFLQIYIDKAGGVDLTECTYVSERLSERLDEDDPIKGAYFLEVSSPGAERPLKTKEDFANHIGENIFVSLYVHIDGEKEYEGILTDFSNDIVTIDYKYKHKQKQVEIPFDKIAKARLAVKL